MAEKKEKEEEMVSLRETSERLTDIFLELEESGGELTPELEAGLAKYTADRKVKAERIVQFTRRMKTQAAALKIEATELSAMASRRIKTASSLERYLLAEMQALNEKKIQTELFTISRAKIGMPKIDLISDTTIREIDPKFIRTIPEEFKLDKKAVLDFLKAEELVPKEVGHFTVGLFEVVVSERLKVS